MKKKQKKFCKKIRLSKRYFQLLEVLIAAFLILVCAAPTMRIYSAIYREQLKIVRINQADHYVSLVHAHLVERLYKNEIELPEIFQDKTNELNASDLKKELTALAYKCFYNFKVLRPQAEKARDTSKYLLCQLDIILKDAKDTSVAERRYPYMVYIDRGAKKEGDKNIPAQELDQSDQEEEGEGEITPQKALEARIKEALDKKEKIK